MALPIRVSNNTSATQLYFTLNKDNMTAFFNDVGINSPWNAGYGEENSTTHTFDVTYKRIEFSGGRILVCNDATNNDTNVLSSSLFSDVYIFNNALSSNNSQYYTFRKYTGFTDTTGLINSASSDGTVPPFVDSQNPFGYNVYTKNADNTTCTGRFITIEPIHITIYDGSEERTITFKGNTITIPENKQAIHYYSTDIVQIPLNGFRDGQFSKICFSLNALKCPDNNYKFVLTPIFDEPLDVNNSEVMLNNGGTASGTTVYIPYASRNNPQVSEAFTISVGDRINYGNHRNQYPVTKNYVVPKTINTNIGEATTSDTTIAPAVRKNIHYVSHGEIVHVMFNSIIDEQYVSTSFSGNNQRYNIPDDYSDYNTGYEQNNNGAYVRRTYYVSGAHARSLRRNLSIQCNDTTGCTFYVIRTVSHIVNNSPIYTSTIDQLSDLNIGLTNVAGILVYNNLSTSINAEQTKTLTLVNGDVTIGNVEFHLMPSNIYAILSKQSPIVGYEHSSVTSKDKQTAHDIVLPSFSTHARAAFTYIDNKLTQIFPVVETTTLSNVVSQRHTSKSSTIINDVTTYILTLEHQRYDDRYNSFRFLYRNILSNNILNFNDVFNSGYSININATIHMNIRIEVMILGIPLIYHTNADMDVSMNVGNNASATWNTILDDNIKYEFLKFITNYLDLTMHLYVESYSYDIHSIITTGSFKNDWYRFGNTDTFYKHTNNSNQLIVATRLIHMINHVNALQDMFTTTSTKVSYTWICDSSYNTSYNKVFASQNAIHIFYSGNKVNNLYDVKDVYFGSRSQSTNAYLLNDKCKFNGDLCAMPTTAHTGVQAPNNLQYRYSDFSTLANPYTCYWYPINYNTNPKPETISNIAYDQFDYDSISRVTTAQYKCGENIGVESSLTKWVNYTKTFTLEGNRYTYATDSISTNAFDNAASVNNFAAPVLLSTYLYYGTTAPILKNTTQSATIGTSTVTRTTNLYRFKIDTNGIYYGTAANNKTLYNRGDWTPWLYRYPINNDTFNNQTGITANRTNKYVITDVDLNSITTQYYNMYNATSPQPMGNNVSIRQNKNNLIDRENNRIYDGNNTINTNDVTFTISLPDYKKDQILYKTTLSQKTPNSLSVSNKQLKVNYTEDTETTPTSGAMHSMNVNNLWLVYTYIYTSTVWSSTYSSNTPTQYTENNISNKTINLANTTYYVAGETSRLYHYSNGNNNSSTVNANANNAKVIVSAGRTSTYTNTVTATVYANIYHGAIRLSDVLNEANATTYLVSDKNNGITSFMPELTARSITKGTLDNAPEGFFYYERSKFPCMLYITTYSTSGNAHMYNITKADELTGNDIAIKNEQARIVSPDNTNTAFSTLAQTNICRQIIPDMLIYKQNSLWTTTSRVQFMYDDNYFITATGTANGDNVVLRTNGTTNYTYWNVVGGGNVSTDNIEYRFLLKLNNYNRYLSYTGGKYVLTDNANNATYFGTKQIQLTE